MKNIQDFVNVNF